MPSLAETQRLFWHLITAPSGVAPALRADEALVPAVAATFAGDGAFPAVDRLDVYANMYFARLLEALRGDFPKIVTAVGDAAFHNLVTDYLVVHPSENPSLRWAGRQLPSFVRAHALSRERPYLGDLAALEWARVDAFDAADAAPVAREALTALPPEGWPSLRLAAVPSLRVLRLEFPVHDTWRLLDGGAFATAPEPRRTVVRVWREDWSVSHGPVGDSEKRALDGLLAGETFAGLCDRVAADGAAAPAERMTEILARWIGDGVIAWRPALPVVAPP